MLVDTTRQILKFLTVILIVAWEALALTLPVCEFVLENVAYTHIPDMTSSPQKQGPFMPTVDEVEKTLRDLFLF